MYIKQIIIQGFKSYKDQTVIEPFSPKHNVIVGRNGSGKSNFFAAIRFVLSDAYTQLGREERQALLHEGSGAAVMSAYVEIIFDNSDDRFPTGKEELILRRTIGNKKDEYSLDRKNATKADVMNLLESAGFSRSNPYYIVPQGRVTALTNMKDTERLTLLKEVAGTQVYENRRSESIRIMAETDAKRTKIDELLSFIRERLEELEEEKEELKEYQTSDKERRCLEYLIYNREQEEITNALETLEEQRAAGIDETDDNRQKFLDGEEALNQLDQQIKEFKQRLELLKVDKKQYEDERRDTVRSRAKAELEVNDITAGQSSAQASRSQREQNLAQVRQSIQQREGQLAQIMPQYKQARDNEVALKAQLTEATGARQRLYAKQGRNSQFKNKADRDSWLQKEIEDVNVALATRKAQTMQLREDVKANQEELKQEEDGVAEIRSTIENRSESMQTVSTEVDKARDSKDKLMDHRKELWREQAKLDSVVRNAQQEYERAERFLSHMMDQNTSRGVAAVRRIKEQRGLTGAYGTLAELFEVQDRYKTAVEATAGNSLFHYVVDTEETASQLVEILQKEKAGRVTFMPLNRLRPRPANMPKASDAIEMITKMTFDPLYEKALQQVFGKTIICPNLQIASQYARSHGVSAITPEGDRSDKKGALTGGYVDPRQSRIDGVRNLTKWRDDYESHRQRAQQIQRDIERLDQEVTRAVGELQKAEQRRQQQENSYGPLQQELRNKLRSIQEKRDALEAKQRAIENVESQVRDLAAQQSSYEAELASSFKKELTDAEETQLEQLSSSIPDLQRRVTELSNTRSTLEAQKAQAEVELRENLKPMLEQLEMQDDESGSGDGSQKLQDRQRELARLNEAVQAIEARLQETDQSMDEANASLSDLEQRRSGKQKEQEETAKIIDKSQRRSEKSIAKRTLLTEKAAEANRNIRHLGALPEEAFTDKYKNLSSDKAIKRLHKVNEVLKKYTHVNKKAFEQYNNFTKQRDTLTSRREELDTSQKSIRELIDVLDQRKDEAIERTFKQVSKEFANVFSKLVPAGRGRLVIQRKSDRQARGEDEDSAEEQHDGVENYTGVGIAVSFNSKHDEQQRIQQLSGGQKSLCALALVFSIQQCDPAPFYLFDEIDANLDAQYRTAVAKLLQEVSENGQFICTTFRPEMVHVAEKCYGVSYNNKTSSIDVVDREAALEFVEGQISAQ